FMGRTCRAGGALLVFGTKFVPEIYHGARSDHLAGRAGGRGPGAGALRDERGGAFDGGEDGDGAVRSLEAFDHAAVRVARAFAGDALDPDALPRRRAAGAAPRPAGAGGESAGDPQVAAAAVSAQPRAGVSLADGAQPGAGQPGAGGGDDRARAAGD